MPISSPVYSATPGDDEALVAAALRSPQGFQPLYDRWVTPVYQYLYARVDSRADAEDLTSQVFLAVYQALPGYQHRGQFPAWLFTIARNQALSFLRRSQREVSLEDDRPDSLFPDPLEQVVKDEQIMRLRHLVRGLPDDEQDLLHLRYTADLRFADIAELSGRSPDAVKKTLYRLLDRLQSLLKDEAV